MTRVDATTARYAQALFELALEKGRLDAVKHDVERISAELADGRMRAYLVNPRVARAEKQRTLAPLLASFDVLTRDFVGLVLDRGRAPVLLEVGSAFKQLVLKRRGATEGIVESARPLPAADLALLAEAVGARLGKQVLLENRLVPDLIGGVRVYVDNRLLDQSVRGRLAGLRKRLHQAALPA